jgi:HEAT repeat protein
LSVEVVGEAVAAVPVRPQPSDLYAHPRLLVAQAVSVHGVDSVVDTSLALLTGETGYDSLPVSLTFLGGAGASARLARGDLAARGQDHWPRLWGARALRYAWLPHAEPGIVAALGDPSWRVREMAAKVVGQHQCGSAAKPLESLLGGDFPRVQVAAVRALAVVGEVEQAVLLNSMETSESTVQVALAAARRTLRLRLDRTW